MLHLISTGARLCPCRALTLLVLVDFSCVLFIHGLFLACCSIYCSLMRWTMLDKPPRQSFVCGKTSGPSLSCQPALVQSVTDVVSKELCSWFSKGLPLFRADGFGDSGNNLLTSRSVMFCRTPQLSSLAPSAPPRSHFLPSLFRLPDLLSQVASLWHDWI